MADRSDSLMRWAWIEIDQQALRRNTRAFKDLVGDKCRLMAVVKADAYGHGAAACARVMAMAGADAFAVSNVFEGADLRKSGITQPILVLSEPPFDSIPLLVEYDLETAAHTTEFALALGECAAAAGKVARYHTAVETGMTRTGVAWDEVLDFRRAIDFHRGLECAGTFTHFATADSMEDWDFQLQLKRFQAAVDALREAGLDTGAVHCDNTPATIMKPATNFDMVRVGLGLYGLHPNEATPPRISLTPVMSVKARVTRVVSPEVGQGVSYGMTYRVPKRNIQIATIPIGYADGLSRTLSNRIEFLVGGKRVKQVGNICMDACMFAVDVNTVRALNPSDPVSVGDTVTVIGQDGRDAITLDDHAALRGTISYEVACNFGMRLERVYV